jgi:hypothetical protein
MIARSHDANDFLLPAMASVRISQMKDDVKFPKENQSFLVAAAFAPFLV